MKVCTVYEICYKDRYAHNAHVRILNNKYDITIVNDQLQHIICVIE